MEPIVRRAARALVIDDEDRVLLFRGELPDRRPWWFAPGGALDGDESYEEALVRELAEETGISVHIDELQSPVWSRHVPFRWRGVDELHDERYYVVRVSSNAVDSSRMLDAERDVIREHRWWTVDEIANSADQFSPRRMAVLLRPLLRGEMAMTPLDAGL